jgi:hypothetical protein
MEFPTQEAGGSLGIVTRAHAFDHKCFGIFRRLFLLSGFSVDKKALIFAGPITGMKMRGADTILYLLPLEALILLGQRTFQKIFSGEIKCAN